MEEVMKEVNQTKTHNLATVERFNYLYQLPKVIRITAWILRTITNLKSKNKCRGVLSTTERKNAIQKLIKIVQYELEKCEQYKDSSERLRLHKNYNGLLVSMGHIQSKYPIFLPRNHPFINLVIQKSHAQTHHGMVSLTMSKFRHKHLLFNYTSRDDNSLIIMVTSMVSSL